jgi:putative spermidine/putrescine transport system substrate-binding protein
MRKKLGLAALTAASVLTITGCASSASSDTPSDSASSTTVTFAAYGGSGEEAERAAWFDPFTAETGVEVVNDSPVTWAKVQEMVDAGNVIWDVAQGGVTQGVVDNPQLEDIDCDIVDCAAFDDANFPSYPQAVPLFTFAQVVTYNTDTFASDAPTGYDDFYDPSIEGNRLMPGTSNGWAGQLEAALIYDGVPRDELYPLDVDRALKVLDGIKDKIIVQTDDGQCVTQVASGEAAMGICYNGRVGIGVSEGLPVAIAWGKQVQIADYLYIPKGAPNLENAQKLVAYIVDNEGAISNEIAYGGVNPNAPVDEASEWNDYVPTSHEEEGDDAPIVYDQDWWTENMESTIEKINTWLNS